MLPGDLVRFAPEAWGTPLEDRPLGIVLNVEEWRDKAYQGTAHVMVTVMFPTDDIPYSSNIKDFEVVSEAR